MVTTILFDAAGTLIHPAQPVAETYVRVAATFGCQRTADEVKTRFREAVVRLNDDAFLPADVVANTADAEAVDRLKWRKLVAEVMQPPAELLDPLFDELWSHYASPAAWQLFDDAKPTWQALRTNGFELGIASNFDARLLSIWRGLPLAEQPCRIFHSSALGAAKPAIKFFRAIECELERRPEQLLLVGDDYDADYAGASAAGWRAVHLDREGDSGVEGAIRGLMELPELLRQK